eukprot:7381294-Prymnesium_polylepis.1
MDTAECGTQRPPPSCRRPVSTTFTRVIGPSLLGPPPSSGSQHNCTLLSPYSSLLHLRPLPAVPGVLPRYRYTYRSHSRSNASAPPSLRKETQHEFHSQSATSEAKRESCQRVTSPTSRIVHPSSAWGGSGGGSGGVSGGGSGGASGGAPSRAAAGPPPSADAGANAELPHVCQLWPATRRDSRGRMRG